MSDTCTKCGVDVPALLGPPPDNRDTWFRHMVTVRSTTITVHQLRFRRFTRRWWPKNPHDVLSEAFTELKLCDPCAVAVYLFAQGLEAS